MKAVKNSKTKVATKTGGMAKTSGFSMSPQGTTEGDLFTCPHCGSDKFHMVDYDSLLPYWDNEDYPISYVKEVNTTFKCRDCEDIFDITMSIIPTMRAK
jgi:hypothetical protein